MRQLLELYSVVLIKHVAFFTIWAKLTVAFTCTSLPLNLYTSVFGCCWAFGFEQKFWRIDGFGGKKARIGRFAYPYSPPSWSFPLTRNEEINVKLCVYKVQKLHFYKISKEEISPSFRSPRFPSLHIFVEIYRAQYRKATLVDFYQHGVLYMCSDSCADVICKYRCIQKLLRGIRVFVQRKRCLRSSKQQQREILNFAAKWKTI